MRRADDEDIKEILKQFAGSGKEPQFISEKELKDRHDPVPVNEKGEYDPRSLYERLQEQKQKQEDEEAAKNEYSLCDVSLQLAAR